MLVTTFALITGSALPHYAVRIMLGGIVAIIGILLFATPLHQRYRYTKKTFFGMISTIVITVTIALVATHIALISKSANGTITRRYGQMSIFACGQQVEIAPTSVLSATSGDGSYSFSSDGTLQYLGYQTNQDTDAALGSFYQAVGGSISSNVVTIPYDARTKHQLANHQQIDQFTKTNAAGEVYLELRSGEACSVIPDMVSIYVYRYNSGSKKYEKQRIIQHPEAYMFSSRPFATRDCVVVVYGNPKDATTLTCNGYPELHALSPIVQELSL